MKYEEVKKNVSKQLKILRKRSGETQETFASKIGTSKENYAKIEQGKTNLTLENLTQIAEYYHVSFDFICGQEDDKTSLDKLESLIFIEYHKLDIGSQIIEYPTLNINQALFKYLLQSAYIKNNQAIPSDIKNYWMKKEIDECYDSINNKTQMKKVVPIMEELIYPDEHKNNWKQEDLIKEISHQKILFNLERERDS